MDKPFIRGTTKTWKTLVFCIVWQYHNFSVILEDPPILGVHCDKRWKPSHNEFRVGPRLQQSTYQKRELGGIWIQSDWWALQSTTAKTLKTHILNTECSGLLGFVNWRSSMACVKAQYNSSYASLGHLIMTLVNLKSPIKLKNFIFNFIQFKGKK